MPKLKIIDQTIREGMQYRGLMFSPDERARILDFQETLGVDICQAGYPPAHESEMRCVKLLQRRKEEKNYNIRVAGLGRALIKDMTSMLDSGLEDFHLHINIPMERDCREQLKPVREIVSFLRKSAPRPCIGLSILDIGKTSSETLQRYGEYLVKDVKIDILTLPDTSGIMAPDTMYQRIGEITRLASGTSTRIGVHCHNDMGMASANTVMGIAAGATAVEATALGIGERNGIADLFLVGRTLKDQGYDMNLDTNNIEGFRAYYRYIDRICLEKTGESVMNYNTPFFGDAMKTHVAGTHASRSYGLKNEQAFFVNVLCGKKLISEHLSMLGIDYDINRIADIVEAIKAKSASISRSLDAGQIRDIVKKMQS